MSLSDKIKNAFGSDHSPEAERGVVDHRTPGSFPVDEPPTSAGVQSGVDQPRIGEKPVPSSGHTDLGGTRQDPIYDSGSQHNKLHKKDDPRGHDFTALGASHKGYLGHDYKDSGIELKRDSSKSHHEDSQDSTQGAYLTGSQKESHSGSVESPSIIGTRRSDAGAGSLHHKDISNDRSGQKTAQTGLGGVATSDYGGNDAGASTTTGIPRAESGLREVHESYNKVANGRGKSVTQAEEPYWGDLPQGVGTYNTVTGHGSAEDTTKQHRVIPKPDEYERVSQTLASEDNLAHGAGVYNTVTGHGSDRDQAEHQQLHHKSGTQQIVPSGVGVLTTDSNDQRSQQSSRDYRTAETAGILRAGAVAYGAGEQYENHKEQDFPGSETHGKANTATESKYEPARDPKDHTKLFGTLRHEKQPGDAAQSYSNQAQHSHQPEAKTAKEDNHDSKFLAFLHRKKQEGHEEESRQMKKKLSNETTHVHESPIGGVAQSTTVPSESTTSTQTSSSYSSASTSVPYQPGNAAASGITASQPGKDDSSFNRSATIVGGAGAVAGAGYGASKLAKQEQHHETAPNHGLAQQPNQSSLLDSGRSDQHPTAATEYIPEHSSDNVASGASGLRSAGVDISALTSASSANQPDQPYNTLSDGTLSGVKHGNEGLSASTGVLTGNLSSNLDHSAKPLSGVKDGYNHLTSGTPSGVHLE
ncbi:hypothetical protein JX265_003811 [Neoarthrinium moseri]|uniref:Uncharacterized protein n=1 Tax=Neoarthrinium moseri TaxID=1658444 RepID=A0A9P9WSX9_9PEZI|nr:hypothetical protein JX265_003811 [Neoarthrinium moseri]